MKYHIPINSIYLEIVKIRYKNSEYMKCMVNYCSKTSGTIIHTQKNLKINLATMKHWEKWNENV